MRREGKSTSADCHFERSSAFPLGEEGQNYFRLRTRDFSQVPRALELRPDDGRLLLRIQLLANAPEFHEIQRRHGANNRTEHDVNDCIHYADYPFPFRLNWRNA